MTRFFYYDPNIGKVLLDDSTILLTLEFASLLKEDRNKCKEDPKGILKLRAFKEFSYIYLAIDWQSIYAGFSEQERHEAALKDSGLTEEEFNDPTFRAACRKYRNIQDSNRYVRLLQSALTVTDKIIDYFDNIDFNLTKEDGTPLIKVADIQKAMEQSVKQIESLKLIESLVKKEITEQSTIRGGATEGYVPHLS